MTKTNRSQVSGVVMRITILAAQADEAIKHNVKIIRRLRREVQAEVDKLTDDEKFSAKGDRYREYLEALDEYAGNAAQTSSEFRSQVVGLSDKISTELHF